jgi:hypothetical protein
MNVRSFHEHLVQTQKAGLLRLLINPVISRRFAIPNGCRRVTVVDSVAARSSRFNAVQHLKENPRLKTQDLPGGVQVENLVPNRVPEPFESC